MVRLDWMRLFAAMHYLTLPAAYAGVGTFMVFLVATDLSEQMKQLAITDQLTGVLNRRGFQDGALRAISQARRKGTSLTVVMADLDHFKRVNDTYGHGVVIVALRGFATHLSSELRQGDLVGRIGGEEFALLLVDTDIDGGRQVAHRLCYSFAIAGLEARGARVQLTASFGVATLDEADGDVQDLLDRADRGLYMAKETGRNRVCVTPGDPRESGSRRRLDDGEQRRDGVQRFHDVRRAFVRRTAEAHRDEIAGRVEQDALALVAGCKEPRRIAVVDPPVAAVRRIGVEMRGRARVVRPARQQTLPSQMPSRR